MKKIKKIHCQLNLAFKSIYLAFKSPYFYFIQGHYYLGKDDLALIKKLVGKQTNKVVEDFEVKFSSLVGRGESVSYAAARMGFYDLMRILAIGKGDEVILLGSTCAVMSTAIIQTGATPIYSEIDSETFGSSSVNITKCITKNTRMIVAQHSFGIPCDIIPIVKIANEKKIFLLEDCALTLGSKVNDVVVGNFGDAALFSTDHGKPINTMIGGMIYLKDKNLANLLRSSRNLCEELPLKKHLALWNRLIIEKYLCNSKHSGKILLADILYSICKKLFRLNDPFLSDDFKVEWSNKGYPYPAKMPAFLAQVGLYEIARWELNVNTRVNNFYSFLSVLDRSEIKAFLPAAYNKSSLEIIPFRFVWSEPNGVKRREELSDFISVDWTWFMEPLISPKGLLEEFKYVTGTCPISEKIGAGMVNIPCHLLSKDHQLLLKKLDEVLT